MVIGAMADSSDGRLNDLHGVALQPGFKQKIIQWCFDAVSPGLTVEVSDPIPTPRNSSNVCYVIYVPESDLAPHFLNGRKGIYIRTDEFSQRFEPKLATQDELLALFERRRGIVQRRQDLVCRARNRFNSFIETRYLDLGHRTDGIGARFDLSIVPRFPATPITTEAAALENIRTLRLDWRQVGFPRTTGGIIAQHESAIVLRPASSFSILEFNVWGLLYYASEIELRVRLKTLGFEACS